jgi:hypothetical protein
MRFPQATVQRCGLASVSSQSFSTHEFLLLTTVLDTDVRLPGLVENLEGEVLDIGLHLEIIEFAADETLGVEDTTQME